jgi:hypothetical protein
MFYATMKEMLEDAINDPETFDQADRMYTQLFRSEPITAATAFAGYPSDMAYFGFSDGDLVVSLCNYKGEEEGEPWELFTDDLRALPIWKDKETSWFQV